MNFLEKGVRKFKREAFVQNQALFKKLARTQSPRVLFITCTDSRVVPSLITQTSPGDLFVERNPGAMVPIYSNSTAVGVSASIEYAMEVLGCDHVVVCGHSDCGAVNGILNPETLKPLPAVQRWLSYGTRSRQQLLKFGKDLPESKQLDLLSQLNVVTQLEHLKTHPSVARRLKQRKLTLHGWIYRIHDGEILGLRPKTGDFQPWPS